MEMNKHFSIILSDCDSCCEYFSRSEKEEDAEHRLKRINSFRKCGKIRKVRLSPAFHPTCVKGLGMAAAAVHGEKEKKKKKWHHRQFSITLHHRFQVSQVAVEGHKHNDSVASPHLATLPRDEAERKPF